MMQSITQEITGASVREKPELKLVIENYDGAEIVSRKIKLNFTDAEWWVSIDAQDPEEDFEGFDVHFHFSHKADQLRDLTSSSFDYEAAFKGNLKTSDERIQLASISNPWTSEAIFYPCQRIPSRLEFVFVFTVHRVETHRFKGKAFSSAEKFNAAAINYWKKQTDPAKADFTFVVQGKEFKVHKSILEAASPYFERLFESSMKESLDNLCTVDQFKPEAFESMIHFIYEAKLPKNLKEIAQELYEVAHYFGLEQLEGMCAEKILPQLSIKNAVDLYSFAYVYDLEELKENAWKIIKFKILKFYFPMKGEPLSPASLKELIDHQKSERQFWNDLKDDKTAQGNKEEA